MATIAEKNVIVKFSTDTTQAQRGIKKVEGQVKGLSNTFQSAAGTFAGLFAFDAIGRLTSGLGSLAQRTGQLAISAEQTQIAFTTFLGSAEAARDVIAELNEFSELTPFEPDEVIRAGQSLLAFGVEANKLTPTLKALGDLSAGTGANFNELAELFGKARVQGRLFADDINQIQGRGINITRELAAQFEVEEDAVRSLVEAGRVGFKDLEQAFVNLTSEGGKFFDLTARQSQSVAGRISTLVGNFDALLRGIGERLLPAIGAAVDKASELVGAFRRLVDVPVSERLEEQRIDLIALQAELNQTNISEERRVEIINQLIQQYPDYLQGINAETASNEELNRALEVVNEALTNRIRLQLQQEAVDRRESELKANLRLIEDQRRVVIDQLATVQSKLTTEVDLTNKSLEEQVKLVAEQARIDGVAFIGRNELTEQFKAYQSFLPGLQTAQQNLNTQIQEQIRLDKELNGAVVLNTESTEDATKATNNQAEATKALTKEQEKQLKLAAELAELNRQISVQIEDELNKQITAEEKAALRRAEIRLKERQQAIQDAIEASDRLREELPLVPTDEEAKLQEQEQKRLAAANRQLNALVRQAESERNALLSQESLTSDQRERAEFEFNQTIKQIQIDRLQAELDILDLTGEEIAAKEQEIENLRTEIKRDAIDQRRQLELESAEETIRIVSQVAKVSIDAAKEVAQSQIDQLDKRVQAQQKAVDDAAELAESGSAELLEIEERRLNKLIEERERAAERLRTITQIEVAASQAAAVANGILAVSKAFAESVPSGIAAAVSLAATVAVAIAQLNQAFGEVPAFATGTEYFEGKGSGTSDSNLARISRGERIVPAKENSKYFDTLNEFQRDTPLAQVLHNIAQGNMSLPLVASSKQAAGSSYDMRKMEKQLSGLNKRFDRLQMNVNLDKDGFSASLDKWHNKINRRKSRIGG